MSTLEWVDSHTHLEHEYPFTVDEYLANARASGVKTFVTIGTTPESLERVCASAEKYPDVYFTVGIHPHEAKDYNADVEATMDRLRAHKKCVGIGEIGLDYYYNHSEQDTQKKVFERQLELAATWRKPVIIHARDAEADLLERLTTYASKSQAPGGPGVIHCFSGTAHFASECLKLGFYISFSGIVTFKKAQEIRDVATTTPLDRILLETDSPFLAPVPYRGKTNQSAYLIETAKLIAQIRNIDLATLSAATVANSRRFFALS